MIPLVLALFIFARIPTVSAYTSFSIRNVPEQVASPCVVYKPVTVFFPSKSVQVFTCEQEVEQIITDLGEDPNYFEPVYDVQTNKGRDIVLTAVEKSRSIVWNKLSFPIEITYTKSLPHRKKVIQKKGATGLQGVITETITYPDGKKKTKTLSKWVEREPKTEYAKIGTKYDLQSKVVDGKTIYYWGTLTVKATSYDHSCYGCNYTTATGAYLKKGIVAVDPKIIAMHTTMYIPGYGFGKAEDTGGKIKGNRIDLAYDDIRYGDWSKRWVTIYLVD